MSSRLAKFQTTAASLVQARGSQPSAEETAEAAGLSPGDACLSMRMSHPPLSLDEPIGERRESCVGELLQDYRESDPLQRTNEDLLKSRITEVLQGLSYRERTIVRFRFGFADGRIHTLGDLGTIFGVTRERIRQIEREALDKLKLPTTTRKLVGFLDMPLQTTLRN
jgi:RNA polymerase primary sigma factor